MLKTMLIIRLKRNIYLGKQVGIFLGYTIQLPVIYTEASAAVLFSYAAQHDTQGTAQGLRKGYITSFTLISPMAFTLSSLL